MLRRSLIFLSVLACGVAGRRVAAEHRLEFFWCPSEAQTLWSATDTYVVWGAIATSDDVEDRVRGWSVGLAVEGAEIVPELVFGSRQDTPPGDNGLAIRVPAVIDDDGDPSTPPVESAPLDLYDDGLGTIDPATLSGDPPASGLVSQVALGEPGGVTLPSARKVGIFRITLRLTVGSRVTLRFVDGLEGPDGPVANVVETVHGPAPLEPAECAFDVRLDPRSFTLSVVPEGDAILPALEDGFAVLEKTVPSGPQRITCLLRLASDGLDPEVGPQGWSVGVRHDAGLTVPSTLDSWGCPDFRDDPFSGVRVWTVFDHDGSPSTPDLDPYDLDLADSHFKMAMSASAAGCSTDPDESARGIVSAVVLSFTHKMFLQPNHASAILRVSYDVDVRPGPNPVLRIWYEDGLAVPRCSCAVTNAITVDGASYYPTETIGLALRLTGSGSWPSEFVRGDANADGRADLSDAITILGFLFLHEPLTLPCRKSADTNDSGRLDISDSIHLLSFLYLGGPPPPAPFPACGSDRITTDDLTCESFAPCP